MSNFNKGIYDLLLNCEESELFGDEETLELNLEIDSDDWLINQFSRFLKKELLNFSSIEEKIEFLNRLVSNDEKKITSKKASRKEFSTNNLIGLSQNKLIKKKIWDNLKEEFKTSNSVQMISPFIANDMVNKLRNIFEEIQINDRDFKLQIITTTYDGGAKFLALKELRELHTKFIDKLEIKIENLFDKSNKRLHIKAYLFNRNNGFSSLYIGSSNFTLTGLITGKEHNVKISEFREKELINEFKGEFNEMWNDSNFVDIFDQDAVNKIILRQGVAKPQPVTEEEFDFLENQENQLEKQLNNTFKPFSFQKEIIVNVMKRIQNEINMHLLVMATGTGKTLTMYFIYNEIAKILNKDLPSLLYIAPSKEILDQTIKTFRNLLEYDEFGVEFYDSRNNNIDIFSENIIFTNIESLKGKGEFLKEKKIDVVVFDEAHHIEAKTFTNIYEIVKPNTLQMFGLTATPERSDGVNVSKFFGHDYAADIKLFDAIDMDLLSDFDYYFIKDDSTNLSKIDLKVSKKLSEALNLKERHEFVYKMIKEYIGEHRTDCKVILFCASKNHAVDLSNFLKSHGEKSNYLISSEISKEERNIILKDFKRGAINFLCVINILNEGVDIPEIDHVIFLRPTASLILYIQQLGRGLRKVTDKRLQIFDFVNNVDLNVNKKYNPILAFNALTNNLKINNFEKYVDNINQYLPGDSSFVFSKMMKDSFLKQLKTYEKYNLYKTIIDEYKTGSYEDYQSFFNDKNVDIYDFYNSKKTFFEENYKLNATLRKFLLFNSINLIKELIWMLKEKQKSKNQIINNLFLVSFYYNAEKKDPFYKNLDLAFGLVFEKKQEFLIKEILFLLQFKIDNENLKTFKIDNTIESFKGLHLSWIQMQGLCSICIKKDGFTGKAQGGVMSNIEDKVYVIDASIKTVETNFAHQDYYDFKTKKFYWDSPDSWKLNDKNFNSVQNNMRNIQEFKTFVFYQDNELINLKGKDAKEFIGEVEEILDTSEISQSATSKRSNKKPRLVFKIK